MFASMIRKLRNGNDLSQKKLAEAVFISPSAISQYENGKAMPSRETLNQLAQFFGVSVNYLLGTSSNPDVEQLLTKEFVDGVSVSEFVRLCVTTAPEDRATILKIVRSLSSSNDTNLPQKKEKVCR